MTDTQNFKKVIQVLISTSSPNRFRFSCFGKWYDLERNTKDPDFIAAFDWAIKELVSNGDYGIAVWSLRKEVQDAWCIYHEKMAKHFAEELMNE